MVSLYFKSILLVLLVIGFGACEDDDPKVELIEGMVVYMAPPDNCNDFVIASEHAQQEHLLKPNNLVDSLKVDSLKIRFAFDSTDQKHFCGFGGNIPVIKLTQVEVQGFCTEQVQLDAHAYENEATDHYFMQSASISGNCLKVTFSASGCDGNSWQVKMVDSRQILESFPVQRRIRLILNNQELCQAVFTRSFYFDLTPTQLEAYNEILFGIEGLDELISYKY